MVGEPTYPAERFPAETWADLPQSKQGHISYHPVGNEIRDNTSRASAGMAALRLYAEQAYGTRDDVVSTVFGDLLVDLMHAADALGLDFHAMCDHSGGHYDEELRGY